MFSLIKIGFKICFCKIDLKIYIKILKKILFKSSTLGHKEQLKSNKSVAWLFLD